MKRVSAAAAAIAAVTAAPAANAAPCSDLPNPVYLSAGSIFEPVVRRLSPILRGAAGADQMTPIFVFSQTCDTVRRFSDRSALAGNGRIYAPDGMATQCEIPAGTLPDVGVGDLFATSCAALNPAIDVTRMTDTPTMVIAMGLIVPVASDQNAISAEEGYFVWGFGMQGMVAPWVDDNLIFRRTVTSGTQYIISQGINVPTGRFLGVDGMNTQNLLMRVAASPTPRATIGILGLNEADANRATVRTLAFRAYGQDNFYWADSRRSSFDKRNVRDGHYQLWGYQNAYVAAESPPDSRARRFVEYIAGSRPLPSGDMTDVAIASSFVPQCAMEVTRTANDDGTSITAYAPPQSCACYFDATVPMGATPCRTCTATADCAAAGVCRRGYCEAR